MVEDFLNRVAVFFPRLGTVIDTHFRVLEEWLPVDVVVLDTGTANVPLTIQHHLGRVPVGMEILNQETGAGLGSVSWYREVGDDAWDARSVVARFTVANARVLLRIW